MFARKVLHTLFAVALLGVFTASSIGAVPNPRRTTYFTFSGSVRLPGVALPAGTYVFEVVNADSSADIVRVMNRDRSKVYAMEITRAEHRPHVKDLKPAIVFGERPAGMPPAVQSWFPEGETVGRAFIY